MGTRTGNRSWYRTSANSSNVMPLYPMLGKPLARAARLRSNRVNPWRLKYFLTPFSGVCPKTKIREINSRSEVSSSNPYRRTVANAAAPHEKSRFCRMTFSCRSSRRLLTRFPTLVMPPSNIRLTSAPLAGSPQPKRRNDPKTVVMR